jgi:hypothetical protein
LSFWRSGLKLEARSVRDWFWTVLIERLSGMAYKLSRPVFVSIVPEGKLSKLSLMLCLADKCCWEFLSDLVDPF